MLQKQQNIFFYIYVDKGIDNSILNRNGTFYKNVFTELGVNTNSINFCQHVAKEIVRRNLN